MFDRIKIVNLFGNFNYDINWKPEGVTILTGPNGFGKSTILRIIEALYNRDILYFLNLEFKEIQLFNSGNNLLHIIKSNKNISIDNFRAEINTLKNALEEKEFSNIIKSKNEIINLAIENEINIAKYINFMLKRKLIDNSVHENQSKPLNRIKKIMRETSGEVRLIKEQRLIKEEDINKKEKKMINIIDELPENLKEIISNVSSEYSAISNKLDSTYPNRLFSTSKGINEAEYSKKISDMNERFKKLAQFDMSDIKSPRNVAFMPEHAKALKVYFEDFEKKYEVFTDIVKKMEMFTKIVNDRLKFKEVKISREHGVEVFKIGTSKNPLRLNQLSSGEKQEIILFYDLIFEVDDNVHLLIDEPEISLHIEWQLKFMDDLLLIAKYKKLKVTVATHSPQIINNHWDIQVDLGELYDEFNTSQS